MASAEASKSLITVNTININVWWTKSLAINIEVLPASSSAKLLSKFRHSKGVDPFF